MSKTQAPDPAPLSATVAAALRRAFNLGQTYWQQADSDSYSQNAKAHITHGKFIELLEETTAAVDAIPAPEGALHAFKNFHQRLCERFGYFHDEQDWQRDLCSLEEHIAALAGPAPQAPDMVSVPLTVLEDASSSLGHYLSDRGWSDEDMQAMDNLDAYIARHKANAAAKQTKEPTNDR